MRFLTIFALSFLFIQPVLSETPVSVIVKGSGDIQKTTGIVISKEGKVTKIDATGERIGEDLTKVSFTVPDTLVTHVGFFSGEIVTSEGKFFSSVLKSNNVADAFILPTCENHPSLIPTMSQLGYVKALIDTRRKQRELGFEKIQSLLKPELISKLTVLETAAGLYPGKDMSPNDHPLELIDRLSRLLAVIERSSP